MRKHSVLALSLLVLSCSGDGDPGGTGGSGGSAGTRGSGGSGGATGGTGGSTTGGSGGSATGGTGGSATGGAGGSGGSTTGGAGGSGGSTTGGASGTGGSTSGGASGSGGSTSGGAGGSSGAGTGGSAGSAGSGAKDAGSAGSGGTSDSGIGDSGKGGSGMADVASDTPTTCPVGKFPSVTDFSKVGPFMAAPSEAGGSTCTVFRPTVLGEGGVKHPVVIWGNGTGSPGPGVYTWLLAQWATHGFVVVAANTGSAGTGNEMVACLDWIEAQNSVAGSIFQGKIALGRAAASGHSQGGGGTLMAGRDARFLTTVPFMAYTQQGFGGFDNASVPLQKGPMLLLSGSADTIAPPAANQQPVFMNTNVPVLWGTLTGADHVTFALGLSLGGGGAAVVGYLGPSTAWLRLHLMCDETARPMFYGTPACSLCQDTQWTVQRKGIN